MLTCEAQCHRPRVAVVVPWAQARGRHQGWVHYAAWESGSQVWQAARSRDGLFIAVLQRATLLTDQTQPTVETPASLERIARTADDTRYQRRESSVVLWEAHVLPEKLSPAVFRRALVVAE